jgi:hypothetical protein
VTFSFRFPYRKPFARLFSKCHMFRLSNSFLFVHPNNIRGGVKMIKLLVMKFSSSTHRGPDVLLRNLFSNSVSPHSFFNVRDQFHPYTSQQSKLKFLYQFLSFQVPEVKAILTELPELSFFLALFSTQLIACRRFCYCES